MKTQRDPPFPRGDCIAGLPSEVSNLDPRLRVLPGEGGEKGGRGGGGGGRDNGATQSHHCPHCIMG